MKADQYTGICPHPDFLPLSGLHGVVTDLRYACEDNFTGRNLYEGRDCAWLHREAAIALQTAANALQRLQPGYHIIVYDALRPHQIQIALWNFLAGTPLQMYVADPARGSIHSFGMAVDVSILDEHGRALDMGTAFDAFDPRSQPRLEQQFLASGELTTQQVANRQLLNRLMQEAGFHGIPTEWWHFNMGDPAQVRATYPRID
jgi:D-alanyl-D-alanine dipeptidase